MPDAGAGQASNPKGRPIARNNVEQLLDDGSYSKHIPFKEAFALVEQGQAHWDGIARGYSSMFKAIRFYPQIVTPQGFLNKWKELPSGNYLPEIPVPRGCKGMRGELVLQLV